MLSMPKIKKVEEVMDTTYATITENMTIKDVIRQAKKDNKKTFIVTYKKNLLKGVISVTDIHSLRKGDKFNEESEINTIMNTDIISASKGTNIDDCRDLMTKNNIGILPIIEEDKLIGILTQKHIRKNIYMNIEDYSRTLKRIIGSIREGICALNEDGVVILWNEFMEKRYCIKSEEIVGIKMNKFLENTISEKVLNKKVPMSDMYSTYKSENMYSFVHANPIFYKDEFLGVVCTEVDIADAKKLSIELQQANDRIKYLQNEVKNLSNGSFDKILGKSYKLEKAKQIAKQVSKTQSSLFICGESGTGKEVFARAIHEYSERCGQFIPINCSAIPSELFESEFFGYESGSFTGANKKGKMGIFELAKDGTIFLDEIADMPITMQAKLLRVLQEKEIRRIGGEHVIKVNARIISATNKNLKELVIKEKFREDLYYRLNVVEINIPPLRERKDDIPLLIHNFMENLCKENKKTILNIDKDAINLLQNYNWKGNIRELRNTIENLVVLANDVDIHTKDLPDYIVKSVESNSDEEVYPLDLARATQKIETMNILKALKISNGNKARAAKILNIPRTTLYYKIDRYKININN